MIHKEGKSDSRTESIINAGARGERVNLDCLVTSCRQWHRVTKAGCGQCNYSYRCDLLLHAHVPSGDSQLIICLYVTLERANISKRLIIDSTFLWIMLVNQTCRGSYTRCNTQHKGGFAKKPFNWFDKNILYSMDMSLSKYFSVRMSFKNNHA